MPRIAKTYAEQLKSDPDIELIHFSRDQNDEKALAWAKEHDVKFPVVKPKGGNPLDLHSRGIPHLFIVKADGALLSEGHPAKLFTDENLRLLKAGTFTKPETATEKTREQRILRQQQGRISVGKENVGGYTWSYSIRNGGASIEAPRGRFECAVSPRPEGELIIPAKLGGVDVTRIGPSAFARCAITSVIIPSTVTSIGNSAFYECRMRSVVIPSSMKEIGALAFYNSSLQSVSIPEGVTSIDWGAFGDCWLMEKVTIPSSVTNIGKNAIASGSDHMKSIVVSPKNRKFAVKDGLLCTKDGKTIIAAVGGDVKIPMGVTSVGDGTFYKCYNLTSVAIPSSVMSIGDAAFEWCDNIEMFSVAPDSREFAAINGMLCTKDGKTIIAGVNGNVIIPEGVTNIIELAFSGRRGLKSVTIPSSMKAIDAEAFRCCKGLTVVKMCGERPSAGKGVFDYCEALKAIHVPANAESWAGMKEWRGIPLIFDVRMERLQNDQKVSALPKKQRDAEMEALRQQVLDLQAQLKALKAEQDRMKAEKSSGK